VGVQFNVAKGSLPSKWGIGVQYHCTPLEKKKDKTRKNKNDLSKGKSGQRREKQKVFAYPKNRLKDTSGKFAETS